MSTPQTWRTGNDINFKSATNFNTKFYLNYKKLHYYKLI
jgi:hypothetical protein